MTFAIFSVKQKLLRNINPHNSIQSRYYKNKTFFFLIKIIYYNNEWIMNMSMVFATACEM